MQNIMGYARQTVEARRIIEVSHDRHDAVAAQQRRARAVVGKAVNAVAFAQLR